MRSKTSFFNPTLYRQSLLLSAPVGIGMLILWTILYPMVLFIDLFGRPNRWDTVNQLAYYIWNGSQNAIESMPLPGILFGLLLALSLFHYMNTPRSVNMFHALPLRREGIFATQCAVAVTFIVAVHGIVALIVVGVQAMAGLFQLGLVFQWFWMSCLISFFFFAFALFCMMFAGVGWAGAAYFGIFNAVIIFLYNMYQALEDAFYYGVSAGRTPEWVQWLTPLASLQKSIDLSMVADWNRGDPVDYILHGQSTVLIYGLVGVVLLLGALAVYRRRPSESASDVVAIAWAKPLFRFGMALCSGIIFGFGLYMISVDGFSTISMGMKLVLAVLIMIGVGLVGLIIAEMLMEKSMRIGLRWGKPGLAVAVCFVALGFSLKTDLFGTQRYIPDIQDVARAEVSVSGSGSRTEALLTDPQDIALLQDVQKALIAQASVQQERENSQDWDNQLQVSIEYKSNQGETLSYRYYQVCYTDQEEESLTAPLDDIMALLERPAMQYGVIWNMYDTVGIPSHMELSLYDTDGAYIHDISLSEEEMNAVYEALQADVAANNFAKVLLEPHYWEHQYENCLSMEIRSAEKVFYENDGKHEAATISTWRRITISDQMEHTLAVLNQLDEVREYPLVLTSSLKFVD